MDEPEETSCRKSRRRVADPEALKETRRRYRATHKEAHNAYVRRYVELNREAHLARRRRWKKANMARLVIKNREWRARNPEKYEVHKEQARNYQRVQYALSKAERLAAQEALRVKNQSVATKALTGARTRSEFSGNDLFARINMLVPRGIQPTIRDDIISEIVLGALNGDFDIVDLKKNVGLHVRRQLKLFQSPWAPRSLDAPLFDDGGGSLHEAVSVGLWD